MNTFQCLSFQDEKTIWLLDEPATHQSAWHGYDTSVKSATWASSIILLACFTWKLCSPRRVSLYSLAGFMIVETSLTQTDIRTNSLMRMLLVAWLVYAQDHHPGASCPSTPQIETMLILSSLASLLPCQETPCGGGEMCLCFPM